VWPWLSPRPAAAWPTVRCRLPGSEDLNRLDDLRRDLGNVVAGHAEAKQDFLRRSDGVPQARDEARGAARDYRARRLVADAAATSQMKEASLPPAAEAGVVAVVARELSEKQVADAAGRCQNDADRSWQCRPVAAVHLELRSSSCRRPCTDRSVAWYEVF
jgi:hypothetical protein